MAVGKVEKHIYRKIEVRMWGDEKFRALSPMLPSGQGLWLYLLTGPHTSAIPGLFKAGRAAMAEELNWDQEAFDKAFAEVIAQGIVKADWKAKVIWVPKAIERNEPASPNVVKSWRRAWEMLPECDLKREAYESLKSFVYRIGDAFAKAFNETIPKPSAKTIGNQEAVNSKQVAVDKPSLPTLSGGEKDAAAPNDAEAPQAAGESENSDDTQGSLLPADPPAPTVTTKAKQPASEDEFEFAWSIYPKKPGTHSKQDALKQWKARVNQGKQPADMIAGVRRYAAHCEAKGNIGGEFVMHASRFFGASLQFELSWDIPTATARPQGGGFMTTQERNRAISEANARAFLEDDGVTPFDALPPPNDPYTIDME